MTPNKVIAVIDDEPFIVEMVKAFLSLKGYTVRGAFSGQQGIVLAQVEKPDALLLDLMMPDIEGFEVCRQLRAMPEFATLPIIILSARIDPASRQRADEAGATAYLTKPLRMTELTAVLEDVFSGS